MARAAARGCQFVLVSPLRGDLPEEARAEWISNIPGTDTALMMALVHTLVVEGLHDREFLDRYTVGWPVFERYLLGETDGQPKDAAWAAAIIRRRGRHHRGAGAPAARPPRADRGRRTPCSAPNMASSRSGWARCLPPRSGRSACPAAATPMRSARSPITDAATTRCRYRRFRRAATASPTSSRSPASPTCCSIPAAPIATTARPGPIPTSAWSTGPAAIRSIIIRISTACGAPLRRVDTLVVHELGWTATARHADFVLPCTMTLEREDIGGNANDPLLVPMQRIAPPYGEARDDYAIFADLAERLGAREAFTEGRTVRQWLEHLYEPTRKALADSNLPAPSFDEFWAQRWPDPAASARRWRAASCVSATIPMARSCRRRAARSRFSRRPSQASARRTVPVIRPGLRRCRRRRRRRR